MMKNHRTKHPLRVAFAMLLILPYALLLLSSGRMRYLLMREDGIVENFSAACWLLSSIISLLIYLTDRRGNDFGVLRLKRNVFFLLLSVLFFFGFGEEISWGQRLLELETPEPIKAMNEQSELNVHNLAGLQVETSFSFFWFLYAFSAPAAARLSRRIERFLQRVNLPLFPLQMAVLFPINHLISRALEPFFTGKEFNFPVEAKECVFAILFLAGTVWILQKRQPAFDMSLRDAGYSRMPATQAVIKQARVPASSARRPSRARSCLRSGASAPMPPI